MSDSRSGFLSSVTPLAGQPSPVPRPKRSKNSDLSENLRRQLVVQFYVLFRTAQLYERANSAYQKALEALLHALGECFAVEGDAQVAFRQGYWYVNGTRTRFEIDGRMAAESLAQLFEQRQIGGIAFDAAVSREALACFADLFLHAEAPSAPERFALLVNRLADEKIATIILFSPAATGTDALTDLVTVENSRRSARRTFFYAVTMVEGLMQRAQAGESVNFLKAKRVVHSIIDQLLRDEGALVELATLRTYDDYTYAHSVNVSVLSLAIGLRVGLDRHGLSVLGFAALFHDVGKTRLPVELIHKSAEYDDMDWQQMERHPVLGAKVLALTRTFDDYTARGMLVAFRHHTNQDLSGYPKVRQPKLPDLFTRIVKIADSYNAMTSGRAYMKESLTPDEAIRKLLLVAGKVFDPLLLKVLIGVLGIFPVGSLVLLDTQELGIVFRANSDDLSRPQVRIIADATGLKEGLVVADLAEREFPDGPYRRSIIRVLDPQKYGLDLSRFAVK